MYPDYLGPQYGPVFNYNFRGGPPFGERFYGPLEGEPQPWPLEPGSPPPVGTGGQSPGPPQGPPPSHAPQMTTPQGYGAKAVDPRAINACRFKYVYLWLNNGQQFWAWLAYAGRFSVSGWRWTGTRWVYFGIDLKEITSFSCY